MALSSWPVGPINSCGFLFYVRLLGPKVVKTCHEIDDLQGNTVWTRDQFFTFMMIKSTVSKHRRETSGD